MALSHLRAVCLTLFALLLKSGPAFAADKPNVVLILIDDLGQRDLCCYGSTFYKTPNIDAMAKNGIRFTEFYAACPVCSPTIHQDCTTALRLRICS